SLIILLEMVFGSLFAAALVALLFGVHPMTVETIPWLGERKTLLATFFAIWSIICYLRHARATTATTANLSFLRSIFYWLALGLFILALSAKPTVTPLPLMLLLMDFWPLGRLSVRTVLEKLPWLAVAGISSIITVVSQARAGVVAMPSEEGPLHAPLMVCHNIIFYLEKIIAPVGLTSHYPMPVPFDLSDPAIRSGVIGTLILIAILAISLRWTRAFAIGWLIFLIGLLPAMQIIGFTNVVASDKYIYFPAIGLLLILTWAISSIQARARQAGTIALTLAALSIAALEIHGTRHYLTTAWIDTESLFRYMIQYAPQSSSLHSHLGNTLAAAGRLEEALGEHAKAIETGPRLPESYNDMGNTLVIAGRYDDAIRNYESAIRVNPRYALSFRNLGIALRDKGRLKEAIEAFAEAVRLKPGDPESHYDWAIALLQNHQPGEAVQRFEEALKLRPRYPEAESNLGIALDSLGRREEAMQHFRLAVWQNPDYVEGRFNLAQALIARGEKNEAARELEQVLRINPGDAEARATLDSIRSRQ
ncbi:MAG TPA: tetratricopeptide repeat protein, partial [Phycisphaerae bacterium]|nr:tetratricopeptide repeat protein [Phycisphaerae bacterium]